MSKQNNVCKDQGWGTPQAKCGLRERMARIKDLVTPVIAQHRVKTKLHDEQALGQYVKGSHSSSQLDKGKISG